MSISETEIDHGRGLCGKPDLTKYGLSDADIEKMSLPLDRAQSNPPSCLCCGSKMSVEDCTSEGMNQLGMYWLLCPTCPAKPKDPPPPQTYI